ncbi:MAG: lysophospholipid acyltransferase family protein [Treponemataceae bacterium]|jgi:1-acyl-sn-glycerol-3-phosphate acyltransferase|nr:lysophospholipid acyltransferase family protein [Treponemataceae bacterium]
MFRTIRVIFKVIVYMFKKQKLLKEINKIEKAGNEQEVKEKIAPLVIDWAKYCVDATGAQVEVTGIENVPTDRSVVYIGNHQGIFDIPLLLGYIPYQKAFIAKIEILKIPMISDWMKLMKCVFLDRKNPRQSVEAMHQGMENVKNGYSMVIFPEGTRNKGGPVKEFKPGSFKLAFQSEADIVPVTIDGTWKIYEEHKKINPAKIKLTIHPAVKTEGLNKDELREIPAQVQKIVESAL